MTGHGPLAGRVERLLGDVGGAVAGTPALEAAVATAAARFHEPLRVAIAGKVKAGKSTLLNALVGEELAPTDASECTRIVTWYRNGLTYRVEVVPRDHDPQPARFTRDRGAVMVDLDGRDPDEVARIVVEWPSAALRELTLIDTPGIASLTRSVSERAEEFLGAGDGGPPEADAVVYLLRHIHPADRRLLETFREDDLAQPTPVNSIGVLSRADEIGSARLDALAAAGTIADRYRRDSAMRRLVQTVVPVAGLLAQGGATLQQSEYQAFARLAEVSSEQLDRRLLTVDRFAADDVDLPVVSAIRRDLLARFGLFGVRLSVALLRQGVATSPSTLAAELVRRSGLGELRSVLRSHFAERAGVLKARAALLDLEAVLRHPAAELGDDLLARVEEVRASAHEFAELRLLDECRAGRLALTDDEVVDAERLLGVEGNGLHERLGLEPETPAGDLRAAALAAVARWRRRAESPMSARPVAAAAAVLARTGEGLLARIDAGEAEPPVAD